MDRGGHIQELKAEIAELQAEKKAHASIIRDQSGWLAEARDENTKLQAVVDAAKVAVADYQRWVVPHYGAVDGLDELEQAIKEVESE